MLYKIADFLAWVLKTVVGYRKKVVLAQLKLAFPHKSDKEIQKIISECYKRSQEILKKNKKLVMLISDALIEHETLTKEQIDELVRTGKYVPSDEDEIKVEIKKTTKKSEK